METADETFPFPTPDPSDAERTYAQHAPRLWPWHGWYAVVWGERFVGVFPTHRGALLAVVAIDGCPETVIVRHIGGRTALAVPAADGGVA